MDIRLKRKSSPKQVVKEVAEVVIDKLAITDEVKQSIFYRGIIAALLFSLLPMVFPHQSVSAEEIVLDNPMVFSVGDHFEYIDNLTTQAEYEFREETNANKLRKRIKLTNALKTYLESKSSPLSEYTSTILQMNNWKKIIALSNAESTMCRRYPVEYANCWGVGGADLWDMGENLGQGVIAMNDFLNTSPSRSLVKYSKMTFDQMNGLYKQPAGDHWVHNNKVIYNELIELENSIK